MNKLIYFSNIAEDNNSLKSDRNISAKYKNTISYKSVSEISEYENNEEIEESSDFTIKTNKDKSNKKLNESLHSATSQFSKEAHEDKDEEKN